MAVRTHVLQIRLSDEELARVKALAGDASVSGFIRSRVLEDDAATKPVVAVPREGRSEQKQAIRKGARHTAVKQAGEHRTAFDDLPRGLKQGSEKMPKKC